MFRDSKKLGFLVLFLVSLFIVLFVGRSFDATSGQRSFILTSQGIQHFRKWLDVSGGSRLVYQIDYTKYKQLYTDPAQLSAMKKKIEEIILKNIDKRISALWVSDYRSYIQTMNDENYLVVEIWGIANLDEAKKIIGKTVELEFRLPNEAEATASTRAERKKLAQNLYNDIKASPTLFADKSANKWSEDIYYNTFTKVTINQLPSIYQKNVALLDALNPAQISPLLDGTYHTVDTPAGDLKWFTFFRMINREEQVNTTTTDQTITQSALQFNKSYSTVFARSAQGVATGAYAFKGNGLVFNKGEAFVGQEAYNLRIARVAQTVSLWQNTGANTNDALITQTQKAIVKWDLPQGAEEMTNGWQDLTSIQNIIAGFTGAAKGKTIVIPWLGASFVVYIKDTKAASESLYELVEVANIGAGEQGAFKASLEKTILYTLEDIFVKDTVSWLPATVNGEVLDGAYFQMASVGSSQLWQPVVLIQLNDEGKQLFCDITAENIGTQMAIFVGWQLITAPTIQDKICGGTAQIDGQFDAEGAKELSNSLNDGTLPAPLLIRQEEKIDATLWSSALTGALWAAGVGLILIAIMNRYMYGWRKTVVTMWVLVGFIVLLAAILKLVDYALSLSAIAAIILSIGMGVDANVLIFERVREELKDGKTIQQAIAIWYDRSWSAIRDGNLSTGLIALVLFAIGTNIFKWFGSMMLVNMAILLVFNVPLTKILLELMFHKKQVFLKENSRYLEVK
jgi:protein-export membrane protein SecD